MRRSARSPSSTVSIQTRPTEPIELYGYEKVWIDDTSRLKIAVKSRRIGYSFSAGLRAFRKRLKRPGNTIVLSRSERLSKLFIEEAVRPHALSIGAYCRYLDSPYVQGTDVQKHEVILPNGSRIIALPANPDTARGYEGDVVLDEFAFHQDPKKIYSAIEPSITRGFSLEVISTPNGQQGMFHELAKAAGLVDGARAANCVWSAHKTDIYEAVRQGCKDRNGKILDLALLRSACIDEEQWLQEYCGAFLSIASQWISPEIFGDCVDAKASAEELLPTSGYSDLYAGWDIARHKDLSVIWLLEMVGDVTWTRGVVTMEKVPTPDQTAKAEAMLRSGMIKRLAMDKSGMGLPMFETLERKFGSRVEGVQFTVATKEALATNAKSRMEAKKSRIPDDDRIRASFTAVKKTTSITGQPRFDAEYDEKFGHADHWWAFCLAESAAHQPTYHYAEVSGGGCVAKPILAGILTEVL